MPGLVDLTTDEGLRSACEAIGRADTWDPEKRAWITALSETIVWFRHASQAERASLPFQQRLWEHNRVADVGQGNIRIDRALQDGHFRLWFAERSMKPLPQKWEERFNFLTELHDDLVEQLEPFLDRRVPRLKISRVLAVLYPEAMTTVADGGKLHTLARALGMDAGFAPIERHLWVRMRLDSLLGDPGNAPEALAERMTLPWLLYVRLARDASTQPPLGESGTDTGGGPSKLVPLSAQRRRRGLTAIRGLFPGLLSTLEFVRDGVTREALLDFLRASSPDSKTTSLGVVINSLQSEFGAIRTENNNYVLTERGRNVLESQDPSDLADWLLTRILGVDKALVELRDRGPLSKSELIAAVRSMNPGLSSTYGAQAILGWLRSMGVIQSDPQGKLTLATVGQEWAARIHWQPEPLPADDDTVPELDTVSSANGSGSVGPSPTDAIKLPRLSEIIASIQATGHHFPAAQIARLHASLWSHARRHFVILAGLSGAGKTLLARSYASAVTDANSAHQRLTLPVQPGWYDPGALLGFTNPLRNDAYVRTPFLQFLLAAAADPQRPYVVILDEMNLSHPEQYMAPVLSAMETGDAIQLHTEDDFFDGVPRSIAYPQNLVLIGTVNMDETTHGLSDKVLDRAFVIEFWKVDLDGYPRWNTRSLDAAHEHQTREILTSLMRALSPARLHFGWRVVDDVLDFLRVSVDGDGTLPFEQALDSVIYAKILPKLRGEDAPRFREALTACEAVLTQSPLRLEESCAKIAELRRDLEGTGSARFWR